jgi:hypothetical protein
VFMRLRVVESLCHSVVESRAAYAAGKRLKDKGRKQNTGFRSQEKRQSKNQNHNRCITQRSHPPSPLRRATAGHGDRRGRNGVMEPSLRRRVVGS